jgi:opacity protein-like surface antigen
MLLLTLATLAITSSVWGQTPRPLALADAPATEPAAAPATGTSPQPAADEDRWKLTFSVPIWLAGADGDLSVRGHHLSADQDTADDVDELFDSRLNGALALHSEAQRSRFGLLVDAMYLDRSVQGTADATDAEATLRGFIGEVAGIYTLVPPAPGKRGWGMVRVDALGGVRVSSLELGFDSDTFDGDVSRTFFDPYVGARAEVGLTNWLSVKVRGDVGGFGIDAWHTSDFSWNVDTGLEFHLTRWFDIGLGYRWLDYDLNFGSDSSLDVTLSGPIVEVKFNL